MTKLTEYTDDPAPMLKVQSFIKHPINSLKVIGFICRDLRRGETVALFKRNRFHEDDKQKHYFVKHDGYAVSAEVLLDIYERGIDTLFVMEQNGQERVIEYGLSQFSESDITIVYDTIENKLSNIAVDLARNRPRLDVQKVVPVEDCKRIFNGDDVTVE